MSSYCYSLSNQILTRAICICTVYPQPKLSIHIIFNPICIQRFINYYCKTELEMSRTRNKASNTANSSNNNTIFTLPYKDVEINCVVGNILNANTEAVASLCDTRFTLGSGLGKEIKDMLGDRFKAEVHKMKPAVPSQEAVAVKVSGSMGHIEWIILAPAGHADRKSLQVQYLEIINKATQMRIRSLTLPLLGTGQFGLDFRKAANFLKAALPMLPNLGNLERLNFIDLNERTMLSLRDFFQTEMVNNFPSSSSSNRQLQNGSSSSNQSTSNGHNTVTRGRVKTPVTPADGYDGRRNCNDHLPTDIAINLGHMPNPNQGPQLPTISTSAAGDAGSSSGSSAIAQRSLLFNNGRNMSNRLARFLVAEPIADSDDEDSDTDPADVMEVTISSSNSSSSDEDSNSTDSDLEDSSDEEDDTNGDAIIISMQLDEALAAAELDQEEERRFWTVVSVDKLTAGGGGGGHEEQKATTSSRAQQQLDDSTLPCSICLTDMREPMDPSDGLVELTLCSHMYHLNCIRAAFKVKKQCPLCMCWYGSPIGYQPENATMQVRQVPGRVPGHRNANGFHEITYHVPAGIQEEGHIRPGVPYSASTRIAYLPNNEEGTQVLKLLQVAFKRRLIFTVGDSVTTGRKNVPVWNGIHHKTNMDGGAQSYGYPDPGYLGRVREELASVGVQSDQLSC